IFVADCAFLGFENTLQRDMEGKISSSEDTNLLQRIKEFTRLVIEDLAEGRSPKISINRFRNYCMNPEADCICSSDNPKGQEILTLKREPQTYRIDMLLRVLLIVQKLLQENRHASKRDIYYMHPSAFKAQSVVDRAIGDICILFHCSRYNLNVAFPVPVLVEEVEDIVSLAEYILVVEKETVFQRLANDMFCKLNRCIVITGRGYPDVSTRRFLRLLIEKLQLPVHCLVDCDPYGFEILATYRFGSMQMAYDIESLRAPDMKWLGAFPSDSEIYDVPKQCLLPLTEEDKKRTEALLLRCYLKREMPQWRYQQTSTSFCIYISYNSTKTSLDENNFGRLRLELETMLERGVKFEIEALSVHSLSFLSEVYIPSKICLEVTSP
ncbi:hypothetical protein CARUB_v10013943mg, partial [Capsella rubella]